MKRVSLVFLLIFTFEAYATLFGFFKCSDHLVHNPLFIKAYDLFLVERNEYESPKEEIAYKLKKFKVIDFLGDGNEGDVYRVEDKSGRRFILKDFRSEGWTFAVIIAEYLNMSRKGLYKVLGFDPFRKVILFNDIRGIPLDRLGFFMRLAGVDESLIKSLEKRGKLLIDDNLEMNFIFDIDSLEFVEIDPH